VQSTNSKANQQPDRKKKQRNKKGKGDKKPNKNDGGGNTKKRKLKYLCNLFTEDHLTHLCPRLVEAQNLLVQQQLVVLTNPLPHGENMTQASTSVDGGSEGPPPSSSNPLPVNVYMMKGDAYIVTREHNYRMSKYAKKGKEVVNPYVHLHIEKTMGETMTCILIGAFKKASHNMNARATQNYSMVEDLSQTPCVMSALEVLQSFPSQRKALLSSLGSAKTCNPKMIMLDTTDLKPHLPYHVVF
jgi:hypothetical protein